MCYNTLRAGIVSSRERKTLPYLRHKRLGFMRNFKLRELKSHSLWGRQTLIFQRVIPSETLITLRITWLLVITLRDIFGIQTETLNFLVKNWQ